MKIFSRITKIIIVSFVFSISIYGQQKDREIKLTVLKNEPIKVVNIKIKNKIVKSKEKFLENDDWLKDFLIEVENISGQTINYLEIELSFPRDQNGMPRAPATEILKYGVFPPLPGQTPYLNPSEPPLHPGNKTIVGVASYEELLALLDYAGHPRSIQEIKVRIGRVIFTDGTMWSGGSIFRRDPNDPKKWVNQLSQINQSRLLKKMTGICSMENV